MISKQLVELMGGEISFKSQEGKGSCFSFSLTFDYTKQLRNQEYFEQIAQKNIIILAESEKEREYVERIFSSWSNCSLTFVTTIEALNEALADQNYDCVVSYWEPLDSESIKLLETLNNLPHLLLINGYDKNTLISYSTQYHIDLYKVIERPFTPSKLYNILFKEGNFFANRHDDGSSKRLQSVKRALLVEDNETNQIVAMKTLESFGFVVDVANNGLESLNKAKEGEYDIVFMDIQMPVMDGFEASRKIREFNTTLPIIALSAAVMPQDKLQTKQAGMNMHIAKPIDRAELERVVGSYFELVEEEIASVEIDSDLIRIEGIDIEGLIYSLRQSKEDIYKLLYGFAQNYAQVDRFESVDDEAFARFVHKLKGTSGNLKIAKLYALTQAIEQEERAEQKEQQKIELFNTLSEITQAIEEQLPPALWQQSVAFDEEAYQELKASIINDLKEARFIERKRSQKLLGYLEEKLEPQALEEIKKLFDEFAFAKLLIKLEAL